MQISEHLRKSSGGYVHWCPGCGCSHHIAVDKPNRAGATWGFDNNLKKPSFSPSVLIRYAVDHHGTTTYVCHYLLTAGQLKFLSDCTHDLAGKIVNLPALPPGLRDKE